MNTNMIKKIKLTNFLSYGAEGVELEMRPLNIIVGPNGAGKSNLLEAIGFLPAATKTLAGPVRTGGGVSDWIYKGAEDGVAKLSVVLENTPANINLFAAPDLQYQIAFASVKDRFEVLEEKLSTTKPQGRCDKPYLYYEHNVAHTVINTRGEDGGYRKRNLERADIEKDASILSQRKDPDAYPELTYLNSIFSKIRLYREWHFGMSSAMRQSQPTDADDQLLAEDFSNIAVFLNRIIDVYSVKRHLLEAVQELYDGICDIGVKIDSGRAILRVTEESFKNSITANRLSDGSLRFICLAALLLDPNPPPVICIDEPELGMHPDMIGAIAKLAKEASQKTQIVMTTHSSLLLDSFADIPESVVVCERKEGTSSLVRMSADELKVWLDQYNGGLGKMWRDGIIGGNRW